MNALRCLSMAALIALALPVAALELIDLRRPTPPLGGNAEAAQAKNALCLACHGENGITVVPMYPNLAGLPESYLYWQMIAYKEKADPQSVMAQILGGLDDQDLRDFAAFYVSLPGDGRPAIAHPPVDTELASQGEQLYLHGDLARGVVPCQGCHGADARGVSTGERGWPRLRGQPEIYLTGKLNKYRAGEDIDSTQDKIMKGVAAALSDADVAALSAYLAGMIPPPPPESP